MPGLLKNVGLLSFLLFFSSNFSFAEDITITTYYPSPYGSYRELRSARMAIGDNYIDGVAYTWEAVDGDGGEVDYRADLVVQGNVGIGTTSPDAGLQVTSTGGNWTTAGWDKILKLDSAGNNDSCLIFGHRNGWSHGIGVTTDGILRFIRSNAPGNTGLANYDMAISTAGNVGIGTTNPSSKLHVYENGGSGMLTIETDTGGFSCGSGIRLDTDNTVWYLMHTNLHDLWIGGPLSIAGSSIALTIKPTTGYVGIGTHSPGAKLDVQASAATTMLAARILNLRSASSANGLLIDTTRVATDAYALNAQSGGTSRLYVRSDGNVGIGTTNPLSKLHVVGEIIGNGNLNILNSGAAGNGNQVVLRKDGNNAYLWPWGTGTATNTVWVGGGAATNFTVSGVKNFEIPHPLKPNMRLTHSTLEGPEAAVFYRGESQLVNGKVKVVLPDYFESLTRKENRTVLITAKFEGDELISNLAASAVTKGSFFVRAVDDKNPNQKFYWEIKAVRADVPLLVVEKKADKDFPR